jgi:16S rRNA C967 or C1407 C5-methylase (RsmB/RsmF family)/NOL1/NOP2/fmu family ribosome biogenesis protein
LLFKKALILKMDSLPLDFIARIQADDFIPTALLEALELPAPTSVRLHPMRKNNLTNTTPVPWNPNGVYLDKRPSFTYDPLFHAGAYYPQEAGSMYLEQVLQTLDLPQNPVVLDLSAAPGGKSTLIAGFLQHRGVLIANEINRSRAYILSENLTKWGYSNVFVCNHKPSELSALAGQLDVLVVDAPCSGEGMFRKDHQARAEWNLGNASTCAERQTDILEEVWPLLKEGGYLIYSTCTFNPDENEQQLLSFLEDGSASRVKLPAFEGMKPDRNNSGYYFLPNQIKSEGFYIAALQKTEANVRKSKPAKAQLQTGLPSELAQHLSFPTDLQFWQEEDKVFATTAFALDFYPQLKNLKFLKTGTHVASANKKNWTPGYDLVYSLHLKWELPIKKVELTEALQILHGESHQWTAPAGFYFIEFEDQRIAMVKQIGQRFNNMHPTEWRIRHLPK